MLFIPCLAPISCHSLSNGILGTTLEVLTHIDTVGLKENSKACIIFLLGPTRQSKTMSKPVSASEHFIRLEVKKGRERGKDVSGPALKIFCLYPKQEAITRTRVEEEVD